MKKSTLIAVLLGGLFVAVWALRICPVGSLKRSNVEELVWKTPISDISTVSIVSINGNSPLRPVVLVSNDDIKSFVDALRDSTSYRPDHPEYEMDVDIDVKLKNGYVFSLWTSLGGDVGESAVYYYGSSRQRSEKLYELIVRAIAGENVKL